MNKIVAGPNTGINANSVNDTTPTVANNMNSPTDLAMVREFLIEVGMPVEKMNEASWPELRGYLCGRLNL